jgi:membrane-bound metal-dependent hydrolase YbcI (DUF457 family)
MANFSTHVTVAVVASSAAAIAAVNIQLISFDQTLWLILLGTLGGMLPDIDADNSRPVRLLFTILALASVTVVAQAMQYRYEPYWILGAATAAYFAVRYGVFELFNHFTEHRGVFHSLLAAVFFGLLTTFISHDLVHWEVMQSWLNGFFITLGFIVHLLLDECFSVDLTNRRMKKSFGTALKLFHYKNMSVSLLLLAATLALAFNSPSIVPVRQTIDLLHWQVVK